MSGNVSGGPDQRRGAASAANVQRDLIPCLWERVEWIRRAAETSCAVVQDEDGTYFIATAEGGMQVWAARGGRILPEETREHAEHESQPDESDRANGQRSDGTGYSGTDQSAGDG